MIVTGLIALTVILTGVAIRVGVDRGPPAKLRRAGVLGYSKVIMLSGRAGETEVLAAFDRGAFDHVAKPFSIPVLMQRIRRAQAAA